MGLYKVERKNGQIQEVEATSFAEAAAVVDQMDRAAPTPTQEGFITRLLGPTGRAIEGTARGVGSALLSAWQVPGAVKDIVRAGREPVTSAGREFGNMVMDVSRDEAATEFHRPRKDSFGPDLGKYVRSAMAAVPFVGRSVVNMTGKAAEGDFAGALGEAIPLYGPQALVKPARLMKAGAEASARMASGPTRTLAREAGLEPTNLFRPLSGVRGDAGKATGKLRDMADEELGVLLDTEKSLSREITTPGALKAEIRRLISEQDVRFGDEAASQKASLTAEQQRRLGEVDSRLDVERSGIQSRVPEIRSQFNEARAGFPDKAVPAPTLGVTDEVASTGGVIPISSARAGRVAEPAIKASKKAAEKKFGQQLDEAEAPLLEQPLSREELLAAVKDYEPELSSGAAYLRRKIEGGEDAPETIPFGEIRIANKRLGPMKDLTAKGASRSAEEAAFASMEKTNPEAVARFKAAKSDFNKNVAAPYRRGAPAKALESLRKEQPQNVTSIPLDASEQWGMLSRSVAGDPKAVKAIQSDVVFNRMGLTESPQSFAKNWRATPRGTKVSVFGKPTTAAMDRLLDTLEDLESEAATTASAINSGNKALRGELRSDFANRLAADRTSTREASTSLNLAGEALKKEVADDFAARIAAVKPRQTGTTSRLETIERILDEMRPAGFSVDPHLNIWAGRGGLTVRVLDTIGGMIGRGNTRAALSFANAFDTFVKTGRPQALIGSIAATQRREVRDKKEQQQ